MLLTRLHFSTFAFLLLGLQSLLHGAPKPNFLVIVSDDQRPDTIAALGNTVIRTPNLDKLVREGMSFTRAIAPFPLCVPSRAEILTGQTAFRNGIPYAANRFKTQTAFWGQVLQDAGYRTAYAGKWMNDGHPHQRGYEMVKALFSSGGSGPEGRLPQYGRKGRLITGYRGWTFKGQSGKADMTKGVGVTALTSRHIADGTIELLAIEDPSPFFVHVNFAAPHDPLIIPPGYADRYQKTKIPLPKDYREFHPFDHGNLVGRDERLLPWPRTERDVRDEIAAYYAVIEDMDAQIGRILKTLEAIGKDKNTFVIFTSDHGLALGSHGLMGKQNMYNHTIGVPFIVRGPGVKRQSQSEAWIYLRDLFPTTCELARVASPAEIDGRSFAPILMGKPFAERDVVFAYFYDVQRMVRTERWKLIQYPKAGKSQLFNLDADPHELINLIDKPGHGEKVQELSNKLDRWFEQQRTRS